HRWKIKGLKFQGICLFFCDAVSSVGTNLYKYHNNIGCQLSKLNYFGDVKPDCSPFILDKCIRLLGSNSLTPRRSYAIHYLFSCRL
ncbi:hypothetical protein MKW94_018752, partial [Papaver nudicaule]|nr:hypothetical protein [Papaver nudicaule]